MSMQIRFEAWLLLLSLLVGCWLMLVYDLLLLQWLLLRLLQLLVVLPNGRVRS